jgi:hypothetical protein
MGILIGNAAPPQSLIPAESLQRAPTCAAAIAEPADRNVQARDKRRKYEYLAFQLYRAFLRLVRRPVAAA